MANGIWYGSVNDSISRSAVKNVRVRVTDPTTDGLLGLYKDREGTLPLGNPFLTREDGAIQFYVRAGRINVNATKDAESVDFFDEIVMDDWTGAPPVLRYTVESYNTSPVFGDTLGYGGTMYGYVGFGGVCLPDNVAEYTTVQYIGMEIINGADDSYPLTRWGIKFMSNVAPDFIATVTIDGFGVLNVADAVFSGGNTFVWEFDTSGGAPLEIPAIAAPWFASYIYGDNQPIVALTVFDNITPPLSQPTNSRLIVLNDATPSVTTWELPGFVNYSVVSAAGTADCFAISASRDGTKIALGRGATPYWRLLDETLADITPAVTLANRCFAIAVSRDGNFIAAAHHEASPYITVMDVADGYSTSQPPSPPAVHPNIQGAVAWNHNASQLAIVGSAAPRIIIYDMPGFTAASPGPTAYATDPHNGCVFNENSTWLACAAGFGPGLVVYDTSDWSVLDTALPSNGCVCIAYSEALGLVALGDADGVVYLVETTTWTLVDSDSTFATGGNGVTSVSFAYDDTMLVATHNFSPFVIAYNLPALTDSGFRTAEYVALDYAYAGIFVPLV